MCSHMAVPSISCMNLHMDLCMKRTIPVSCMAQENDEWNVHGIVDPYSACITHDTCMDQPHYMCTCAV